MLISESFLTSTLRSHPRGQSVARILAAAIQAVEPGAAVKRFVQRDGQRLSIAGQVYDLEKIGQIRVLGLGKAARAMSLPLADSLAGWLNAVEAPRGLLIPKQAFDSPRAGFEVQVGGHPVPDENSLKAGAKALELARGLDENDLLVCLISGGGSALMSAPHPGLTLDDLQSLTRSLLACGARIDEINTLRRHLDQVKGGGLARAASPARLVSLILSDVVGNPLEAIASGPTAPDPTSKADALAVLEKYGLTDKVPAAVIQTLENAPETPKPGADLFRQVQNVLVGSNFLAAQAALAQAQAEGFQPHFLGDTWQGEAREVAKILCERLIADSKISRFSSKTGRLQNLAPSGDDKILESAQHPFCLVAGGETGETQERARALNLDPDALLERNDSYHFFAALGDLLKPGSSGTNVNDLAFLFGF